MKVFYDAEARVTGHVKGKGKYDSDTGSLDVVMECGKTVSWVDER